MTRVYIGLWLGMTLAAFAQCLSDGVNPANGIVVEPPKVYDDYYLQNQLNALKARLAGMNATDEATLLGKLGQMQGGSLSQSGFAVQGLGPAPAQTTTLTPPQSLPAYAASAPLTSGASAYPPLPVTATGAYGTTTSGPTITPSVPAVPAPTLSLSTAFSPSALDTLNEEMQLSSQIINLQLLLDGALNDRFNGQGLQKRRVTIGFNISVNPCVNAGTPNAGAEAPSPKDEIEHWAGLLKDHVAEVSIEVADQSGAESGVSIISLLPREKTYNVASLTDKSISLGAGGVIAGLVNVGAGFFRGKQTYYLVQQQDTLAVEDSPASFSWQFRPVLNSHFVQAGTRQNFVQVAIPEKFSNALTNCSGLVTVTTAWRRLDPKTGILGPRELEHKERPQGILWVDLPNAYPETISVRDIGGGQVFVNINGGPFLDGTQVRVGPALLGSANVRSSDKLIAFVAPAKDIVTAGAALVNRDGSETPIIPKTAETPVACGTDRTVAPVGAVAVKSDQDANLDIKPYSDTSALVSFRFIEADDGYYRRQDGPLVNPLLVSLGSQIFGLQNSPLRTAEWRPEDNSWRVSLIVPDDLLRANSQIIVQRLFLGPGHAVAIPIPESTFAKADFAITGAAVARTASDKAPYQILITGTGLDRASLAAPVLDCVHIASAPPATYSYLYLEVKKDCEGLGKSLVFTSSSTALPVVVDTPDLGPAKPKPPIDPLKATVDVQATSVVLHGTGLDQVSAVRFEKARLAFTLAPDKKTLTVNLAPDVTAFETVRYLDIRTADGKNYRFELTVKKPS